MAELGDLVRVRTGIGPTHFSQPPIRGCVVATDTGVVDVLWETGVVTEGILSGAGFIAIITAPDPTEVTRLFPKLCRLVGTTQAPEYYCYISEMCTWTLDAPDSVSESRALVRTLAGTYAEFRTSLLEEAPGFSGERPFMNFPRPGR